MSAAVIGYWHGRPLYSISGGEGPDSEGGNGPGVDPNAPDLADPTGGNAPADTIDSGPSSGSNRGGPGQGSGPGDESTPDSSSRDVGPVDTRDDSPGKVNRQERTDLNPTGTQAGSGATGTGNPNPTGFGGQRAITAANMFATGISVVPGLGPLVGAAVRGAASLIDPKAGPEYNDGTNPDFGSARGNRGEGDRGSSLIGDQGAYSDAPSGTPGLAVPVPQPAPGEGGDEGGDGSGSGSDSVLPPIPTLPPTPDIPLPPKVPEFGAGGPGTDSAQDVIERAHRFGRESTLLTGAEGLPTFGDTSTPTLNANATRQAPASVAPTLAGREGTRTQKMSDFLNQRDRVNAERGVNENPPATLPTPPTPGASVGSQPTWGLDDQGNKVPPGTDGFTVGGAFSAHSTPGEALPSDLTLMTRYKTSPFQSVRSSDGRLWVRNVLTGAMYADDAMTLQTGSAQVSVL